MQVLKDWHWIYFIFSRAQGTRLSKNNEFEVISTGYFSGYVLSLILTLFFFCPQKGTYVYKI